MQEQSKLDIGLVFLFFIIPTLGLFVLYSAGYDSSYSFQIAKWLPFELHSRPFIKQVLNIVISIIPFLIGMLLSYRSLKKTIIPLYILTIIALLLVLFIGSSSHGAQRWLDLPGFRFQPSELAKASVLLMLSFYIAKYPPSYEGYDIRSLLLPLFLIFLPVSLVFIQPDLGTSIAIGVSAFALLVLVGVRRRIIIYGAILILLSVLPVWNYVIKPYQKERVLTMLNPELDPFGSGYHIIQSKIAVGSGRLFGKGFIKGSQTQLEFLPEHTTDFIFSVLAEEWGFVGCCVVLFLYFLLLKKLFSIALKSKDSFGTFFCFAFATFITFHVFVNTGMVIGIMPVVGLPLPLFSYGGSSLLVIMFLGGIAVNISMQNRRI